ncbi:MAG: NAD(P)H-hydrate dehydratase [Burkholderiaceae bacterium]
MLFFPRTQDGGAFLRTTLRTIEQQALQTLPPGHLMRRAAQAAVDHLLTLPVCGTATRPPVHIVAGPGNNGGDGRTMADILQAQGFDVRVWNIASDRQAPRFAAGAVIVDAIWGIGFRDDQPANDLSETAVRAIQAINAHRAVHDSTVLALDIPSGLQADTGIAAGTSIEASHTLTFIAAKPGLFMADGPDHAGRIAVADLDLSDGDWPQPAATLSADATLGKLLQPRRQASHKGTFGQVQVIGGADGMQGAAVLASRAAMCSGAGKVFVTFANREGRLWVDDRHPEIMQRAADTPATAGDVLVVGPGLGTSTLAVSLLETALRRSVPTLLDADALNILASTPSVAHLLKTRTAPLVMTPHPAEAARLLSTTTAAVQADRIAAAQALARHFRAEIVLKGVGTVIVCHDGTFINLSGSPALASAGTGDVLSGLLASLWAQGLTPSAAVRFGVWLHGRAAEAIPGETHAPFCLTASQLIGRIQQILDRTLIRRNP